MKHEMNRLTENKGPRLNRFNMETLERKLAKEMCNASNVKKRPGLERNELWKLAIEMSKDPQKSPEEKKVLGMYCLCFHLIENDAQGSLFQIRRQVSFFFFLLQFGKSYVYQYRLCVYEE